MPIETLHAPHGASESVQKQIEAWMHHPQCVTRGGTKTDCERCKKILEDK